MRYHKKKGTYTHMYVYIYIMYVFMAYFVKSTIKLI